MARSSTSNDSIQIEENKIIAADKNVSPKNVLDTDPIKKVCKIDYENRQTKK
jgi:hypothetical protein